MERTTDYYEHAATVLRRLHIGTLATATNSGDPWNTPLVIERDANLRLYWFSDRMSQHARNVRENSRVFIVFYDSTVPDGRGRFGGVYIKALARELQNVDEIRRACLVRKDDLNYPKKFMGRAVRRVYMAEPEATWINDVEIKDGTFIRDRRVKLSIKRLRRYLALQAD